MAISSSVVWEIRSTATASNVNGGGFKTGATGVDYSQQDAAQYNLTGATSAGAGAVILHASAAADMVGNIAHVISGTNFTAGWYEITAVSAGVSITVDSNVTSGVGAVGVINIGGAMSLGHSSDPTFFAVPTAGNTVYIKSGTYTIGAAIVAGNNGTATSIVKVIGYTSTRTDNAPTKPLLTNAGALGVTFANFWNVYNVAFKSDAVNTLQLTVGGKAFNCKSTNNSTTAGRVALLIGTGPGYIHNCELVSYRGFGCSVGAQVMSVNGCYIHDSDVGIRCTGASASISAVYSNNIITSCVTAAIQLTAATTSNMIIMNNTIHGSSTPRGIGISLATGCTHFIVINNIISGFVTGVSHADTQTVGIDDYNCYNNNTTNATNWTLGTNSITSSPAFTSVAEKAGTTATTSGGVLTDSGADFSTVVAGQDYIYIASGTGVTAGIYGITSKTATTITPDIAPGNNATADKVYKITTGRNFSVGANMQAAGFPGTFQAGLTIGYKDIGAAQRLEDYPVLTDVRSSIVYGNSSKTGSLNLPASTNVKLGVSYDNGAQVGTLVGGGSKHLGKSRIG